MTAAALVLYAVYLTVGFGVRTLVQWRRTGDTGFRGLSGRLGSPEWWAGAVLAVAGIVATFLTQLDMGASWRIGVDETEPTDLVTSGAFGLARNPILTAMAMAGTGLGLALMVPNMVALLGFVMLVVALHLQVRVVEEPYLLRTHGSVYAEYAARTGQFMPGLGRLTTPARTDAPA